MDEISAPEWCLDVTKYLRFIINKSEKVKCEKRVDVKTLYFSEIMKVHHKFGKAKLNQAPKLNQHGG